MEKLLWYFIGFTICAVVLGVLTYLFTTWLHVTSEFIALWFGAIVCIDAAQDFNRRMNE